MKQVLNIAKIDKLRDKTKDKFPILVDCFLSDTTEQIESLEAAKLNTNFVQIQEVAHSLKSSAAILGLEVLNEICEELNSTPLDTGASPKVTEANEMISRILTSIDDAKLALTEYASSHHSMMR